MAKPADNSKPPLSKRLQKVIQLYDEEDWSLREIGLHLGVTRERARQLYRDARLKIELHAKRHQNPLYRLSVRAINCLRSRGLVDRSQVLAAIQSGDLHPENCRTRNYGWTTHKEVCRWLGLPELKK